MAPYLDTLISKLLTLLQQGKKLVQEGALTAMASVADASQEQFVRYYDAVMPLLSQVMMCDKCVVVVLCLLFSVITRRRRLLRVCSSSSSGNAHSHTHTHQHDPSKNKHPPTNTTPASPSTNQQKTNHKKVLLNAHGREHRMLRAKALECVSLVGMAVGRERFRADAAAVMSFLQQLHAAELEPDDPTASYMLQAGARLCKALGPEFLPYLGVVMPPLLASATLEPDVKVRGSDDDDDDEDDDDDDVETIQLGDKVRVARFFVLFCVYVSASLARDKGRHGQDSLSHLCIIPALAGATHTHLENTPKCENPHTTKKGAGDPHERARGEGDGVQHDLLLRRRAQGGLLPVRAAGER